MYSLKNDYSEGAHPNILQALISTNMEQTEGYSLDNYTKEAIDLIKERIQAPDADVHILVGGTQTNLTMIASSLRPHQSVIAATTGHIATHETGAIEATGHKVCTIDTEDGKLTPEHIDQVLRSHTDEHMVVPKMVYISNPTELGTLYKKQEIMAIKEYCEQHNLYLYLDGARLASGLASKVNDMQLEDYAKYTDAFYIGATKSGALFGEALVILNASLKEEFRYVIKQKGGLLAKGRLLAIQFIELFKNDLYKETGIHANQMAEKIKDGIASAGYSFLFESYTNQQFPIFPNALIKELEKEYSFIIWEAVDAEHSAVRLVTSWATRKDKVEEFIQKVVQLTM